MWDLTLSALFFCVVTYLGSESKQIMELNLCYDVKFCEVTGSSWFVIQFVTVRESLIKYRAVSWKQCKR